MELLAGYPKLFGLFILKAIVSRKKNADRSDQKYLAGVAVELEVKAGRVRKNEASVINVTK